MEVVNGGFDGVNFMKGAMYTMAGAAVLAVTPFLGAGVVVGGLIAAGGADAGRLVR